MPGCRFYSGSTTFVLPDKVSMGSSEEGLRCAVIQYLTLHGGSCIDTISHHLETSSNKMRGVFKSLERDGTIIMLNCGGHMLPFLCDRREWRRRIRQDETMRGMLAYMIDTDML